MKLNKYKLTEYSTEASEFLIYGKDNFEIPKEIKEIELVQENLNKAELDANFDLVLYEYTDFMILFLPFKGKQKRTRDKILFDAGVVSWGDLEVAYYNIRKHQSNFSKKVRELVVEKYSEIINEI
jgi:hypothetical protein